MIIFVSLCLFAQSVFGLLASRSYLRGSLVGLKIIDLRPYQNLSES